jgi:hypothetical protein
MQYMTRAAMLGAVTTTTLQQRSSNTHYKPATILVES